MPGTGEDSAWVLQVTAYPAVPRVPVAKRVAWLLWARLNRKTTKRISKVYDHNYAYFWQNHLFLFETSIADSIVPWKKQNDLDGILNTCLHSPFWAVAFWAGRSILCQGWTGTAAVCHQTEIMCKPDSSECRWHKFLHECTHGSGTHCISDWCLWSPPHLPLDGSVMGHSI